MKRMQIGVAAVAALLASAGAALGDVIDFEGLDNGLDVETTATPFTNISGGLTTSGGNHLGAAVFDSDDDGPNFGGGDQDLIVNFGNILILQNNNFSDQTGDPNIWDTPNDDEHGGTVHFAFDEAVLMTSIDLIDINGNGATLITLTDGAGATRVFDVPDEWTGDITASEPGFGTLDLTTLADQVGFDSTATASEDAGFDSEDVVSMTVAFNGSGALDNIAFTLASDIPAPGAMVLLGLAGLMGRSSRQRRA